jgi:hypothetical protein
VEVVLPAHITDPTAITVMATPVLEGRGRVTAIMGITAREGIITEAIAPEVTTVRATIVRGISPGATIVRATIVRGISPGATTVREITDRAIITAPVITGLLHHRPVIIVRLVITGCTTTIMCHFSVSITVRCLHLHGVTIKEGLCSARF